MANKKLEDFAPEELEALEPGQYDQLIQDGSLELEATPPPPVKEGDVEPPAPVGVIAPAAPVVEPPALTPEEVWAKEKTELQALLDVANKAGRGLKEDLIKARRDRREGNEAPEEQSELIKRILALEDDALVDAATLKDGILADRKKTVDQQKSENDYYRNLEASKELAMDIYPDYAEVVSKGLAAFAANLESKGEGKGRKFLEDKVFMSPDPAERAYTYGLMGMKLIPEGGKPLPVIAPSGKGPAVKPVILRAGGGPINTVDLEIEDLLKLSPEELERRAIAIEKERLKV